MGGNDSKSYARHIEPPDGLAEDIDLMMAIGDELIKRLKVGQPSPRCGAPSILPSYLYIPPWGCHDPRLTLARGAMGVFNDMLSRDICVGDISSGAIEVFVTDSIVCNGELLQDGEQGSHLLLQLMPPLSDIAQKRYDNKFARAEKILERVRGIQDAVDKAQEGLTEIKRALRRG